MSGFLTIYIAGKDCIPHGSHCKFCPENLVYQLDFRKMWPSYCDGGIPLTEGINGFLARSNEITTDRIQNGISWSNFLVKKANESRVLRPSAKRRNILIIPDGFVIFKSPLEEEYFAKHLKNRMDSDCSPGLTINSSDFSRLFTYSFKFGVLSLSIF